jgi:hypothetical protein
MSFFSVSTNNGKMNIKPKLPPKIPLFTPLLAYNFNLEDLNNNPTDPSYNFLLNYANNSYDSSLNNIAGLVSTIYNSSSTALMPKFGSTSYYGNNGIYGNGASGVRTGNWLKIPTFVIPAATLNSGISLSLWMYITSNTSLNQNQHLFIFNAGSYTTGCFRVYLSSSGGTSTLITQNNGMFYNYNYSPTGIFNNDSWYHIVFTYQLTETTPTNKTTLNIYINGNLVLTTILTGIYIRGNLTYNYIGTIGQEISVNGGVSSNAFPGYIDNFRFYNSVLTSAQVTTLYNDTTGYA